MKRKTKIIATIGPATQEPDMLRQLIEAGVNVFRLNMSHAAHDWVRTVSGHIRSLSAQLGIPTSVLMDLQGPSIRTGDLETPIDIALGDTVEFRPRETSPNHPVSLTSNYQTLADDVEVGRILLVDNGVLRFDIDSIGNGRVVCKAKNEGTLTSRRHINLPGVRLNLPALTEKDRADVALAAKLKLDFVALSFARSAEHLSELRQLLTASGSDAWIVAKIEDQQAVENIEDIIRKADGVMIARGDLGIECSIEELPIIQRRTLERCIRIGKPVIVATHMLESMIENPVPTRAEVTDVANAVFEETDAVMLSGETTVGNFPVRCIQVLDRISRRIEKSGGAGYAVKAELVSEDQKTVNAAVTLADSLEGSAIVVFTRTGGMAQFTSQLRPSSAPIFAFAPDREKAN
ncbi:MAG: pyruvate kinase, partial [Verrucomicrobiota bacterium]